MSNKQTELGRDISREYQSGPAAKYDHILNSMRWLGPQFNKKDHNFHKCHAKKQEQLLNASKKDKGDHIRNWTLETGK